MVYVEMVYTTETVTLHQSTCRSQSLGESHEFEVAVPLRQLNQRTVILMKSCRIPIWSSGQDSWFSPRRPGFDSRYGKHNIILIFQSFSTQITPNFFLAIVEESGGIFIYLLQDTSFSFKKSVIKEETVLIKPRERTLFGLGFFFHCFNIR